MNDIPGMLAGDSREHLRVTDALLVAYTIAEGIAPEFTETYDIGTGGLAMLTNAELPMHQPVTVELELRGDDHPKLRIAGAIRWSHFDAAVGKYRTGVAFTDTGDETQRELLRYIDTIRHLRDLGVL